jgi:hypothetical protein
LDPKIVQYFLDAILAEEGIRDERNAEAKAEVHSKVDPTAAKSKTSSASPVTFIVDFWRSFACENGARDDSQRSQGGGTLAVEMKGDDGTPHSFFDPTFFHELWKELQAYRDSCGSLSDVHDLKAYMTRVRSETPETTTKTDQSCRKPSVGSSLRRSNDPNKFARSEILNFCIPNDKSLSQKERADLILERCKQKFPSLYDKLVQNLDIERARRKLGMYRQNEDPSDSAFSTCTEDYTSDPDFSVETAETSENANDTPRMANKATITNTIVHSMPVGFGVLRAPVASKGASNLPPWSAQPKRDSMKVAAQAYPKEMVGDDPSALKSVSTSKSPNRIKLESASLEEVTRRRVPITVGSAAALENDVHPSSRLALKLDSVSQERATLVEAELQQFESCTMAPAKIVTAQGLQNTGFDEDVLAWKDSAEEDEEKQTELDDQVEPPEPHPKTDPSSTPDSLPQPHECLQNACNPLEPLLEGHVKPSLHPPDVVVRRFSGKDSNEEGFDDDDSFGVHSNLTEEKKWVDDPNEVENDVLTSETPTKQMDVGPKTKESKPMSVILELSETLDATSSDSPGDDNEKSIASSGKEILADLARLTDEDTGWRYSSEPRRNFQNLSRGRPENEKKTERLSSSLHNDPASWESFDSAGFDAIVEPRDLFGARSQKYGPDCEVKQDSWEDFNSSADGPSFFWPKQKATLSAEGTSQQSQEVGLSSAERPQEYLQLRLDKRTPVESDVLSRSPTAGVSPQSQAASDGDCQLTVQPVTKNQHRFSIAGRIRSSSVSRSKSYSSSSMSSPRKGWLRRRPKQALVDEVDPSLRLGFETSPYSECDASLATLDDLPTRALLKSKTSLTSVTRNSRLM